MSRWIVNAFGQDRPGIVAAVAEVLYKMGCNLEDSAMTRLGGEFAIMLVFSADRSVTEARLEDGFNSLGKKMRLGVFLKRLTAREAVAPKRSPRPYIISVYGKDQTGIVYHFSRLLANAKVNITDVETHRSRKRVGIFLYMLLIEIELPASLREPALRQKLRRLAKRLDVEVDLRAADAEVF